MFDIRSLFAMMVATNLVLAVSLWIGTGRRLGGGLKPWAIALFAQAVALALFAAGAQDHAWATVAGAGLLGLSCALFASAILAFRGGALPRTAHAAAFLVPAFAVGALVDDPVARQVAGNTLFAVAQLALLALAWKRVEGVGRGAHGLFLGSFALGTASLVARAAAPLLVAAPAGAGLAPSSLQAFGVMAAYSAVLLSTVSFLLMQRDRADHVSGLLASTDPLTGAFNRRTFVELAKQHLARARRAGTPLSLVLLDVDHFKRVNDVHGHLAGDEALRRFAEVVRDQLREEDIFVRYGGEEFCLLLPDIPGPGAVALAGRIRRAVEKTSFSAAGNRISLTVSAGVAARVNEGPEGLDDIIGRADAALYTAKSRGRNRVAAVSLGAPRAA